MTERQMNIVVLGQMLDEMNPPELFRGAIEAARSRLLDDESRESADFRRAYDWPRCSECGKPYVAMEADYTYVRRVVPACECHAFPKWDGRPSNNGWVYAENCLL